MVKQRKSGFYCHWHCVILSILGHICLGFRGKTRFYRHLNSDRLIQSPECQPLHHRTIRKLLMCMYFKVESRILANLFTLLLKMHRGCHILHQFCIDHNFPELDQTVWLTISASQLSADGTSLQFETKIKQSLRVTQLHLMWLYSTIHYFNVVFIKHIFVHFSLDHLKNTHSQFNNKEIGTKRISDKRLKIFRP